jgi:DNA repair protein RadC
MELSDAASAGAGNLAAPEAAGAARCRQILVDLLEPLGPGAEGWAGRLIGEFGSLAAALAAAPAAQARALGDAAPARFLATIRSAMLHARQSEAAAGLTLGDSRALIDYLSFDMAHLPAERLRVLYLNSRNRLLHDEIVSEGTVRATAVHPRQIMRRALDVGATALILAHNHPSGDPSPSRDDIQATTLLVRAAQALDICIHDHVIVARSGWSSFRLLGLIGPQAACA